MDKDTIRVGIVHTVNATKRTVRVKYAMYGGMMSAELRVAYKNEKWMPEVNDEVLCICPPDSDGDGFVIGRL